MGNTANITNPFSGVYNVIGPASFSFQDGPSGNFTGPVQVFDNQFGLIGFSANSFAFGQHDVIQIWNADIGGTYFQTYDLSHSTPLLGPGPNESLADFTNVETDQGLMSMSWMAENTFQATTLAPEPTTMAILGLGAVALLKRRKV